MFVSNEKVPVTVDGENTIFIRAKMSYGVKQKMQSALVHITRGMGVEALDDAPLDLGAANLALLTLNILEWAGPAFEGVPCDAAHIEALDPDEPLVDAVLAEINRRNVRASAEKNAPPAPASMNGGGPSSRAGAKSR